MHEKRQVCCAGLPDNYAIGYIDIPVNPITDVIFRPECALSRPVIEYHRFSSLNSAQANLSDVNFIKRKTLRDLIRNTYYLNLDMG